MNLRNLIAAILILASPTNVLAQKLKFSVKDTLVYTSPTAFSQCDSSYNISMEFILEHPNTELFILDNKKVVTEILFKDDTVTHKYYFLDGSLKRITSQQFLNGRNLWSWDEAYYQNGQLKYKYNPNLDSVQHLKVFYPDGRLKREMLYHKTSYFSFYREYNPDGSMFIDERLNDYNGEGNNEYGKISRIEHDILGNKKIKIHYENNIEVDTVQYDFIDSKTVLKSYDLVDFWKFNDYTVIEYVKDKTLMVSKEGIFQYALIYNFGTKKEFTVYCDGRISKKKWLMKPK